MIAPALLPSLAMRSSARRAFSICGGLDANQRAQDPALVATEVADYLVASGLPFRDAHEVVGKVLRAAEKEGKSIREMPLERLKEFSPAFGRDLSSVLTVEAALARRAVPGGTAPGAVRAALDDFKARTLKLRENP